MSDYYVLNDDHTVEPTDLMTWARAFEARGGRKHVARDELPDGTTVSTVFLGLDHSFGDGPPLLFETMIFGGEHDQDQWRYSTWNEAVVGHQQALELAKGGAA